MRLATLMLLPLGMTSACSSPTSSPPHTSSPGTATIDGTFTFMPAHYTASAAVSQTDPEHVSIVVTSLTGQDTCSAVEMTSGTGVANAFKVVVTLDSKSMVAPGMYALGNGWQASYRMSDPLCASAGEGDATKGTLEIDSVDTWVHGIADVTFPTGRVLAEFDAPFCNLSAMPSVGGSCAHVALCPAGQGADLNPTPTETCNEIP